MGLKEIFHKSQKWWVPKYIKKIGSQLRKTKESFLALQRRGCTLENGDIVNNLIVGEPSLELWPP